MKSTFLSVLVFILVISSCSSAKFHYQKSDENWNKNKPPTSELLYSLYLIGDAGGDTSNSKPILEGLTARLTADNSRNSGVVFLGDNIYPEGLHKKKSKYRKQDEGRINVQLNAIKEFQGDLVFMPGNHDWDKQGKGGKKHVKRQERYIQDYLDRGNVFLPSHGCPGPEDVKLAPGLVLISIDTQWWLHQFERPSGEKDGCDVRNPEELMVLFKDMLKKYRDHNVVVAGHHPLYSNGHHGGFYQFKDHLFPLTAKFKKAYVPLPLVGSIYPLYRKFLGHPQDIAHPVYREMKKQLVKAMNEYDNVTYVSGHEHNLQYVQKENIHHVVSGAGSKKTHLKFNNSINFGARERGYSKMNYYANGEVWLEFYANSTETNGDQLVFSKKLFQRDVITNQSIAEVEKVSYAKKIATVIPDSLYKASGFKRLFFGDLNRDLWTQPLTVPYLDIHYVHGGLTPIKKGGGMQTLSLRMEAKNGRQYTLRGIKKNATFLTGRNLRGTLAQDMIYDGMAGSHPYASVVIPDLSKAIGIYYAEPTLVYIPDDPILGDYREEFGGMFCLFEERPNGDMSNADNFGNSENVMNYNDAIDKMHKHQHHIVDQDYVLNARLFDMLIGDWDRHDDQWRWATFKEDGKTLYRPIPRDRDQAFFEFDGIFMNIANRKWAIRKFQPFSDDIRDLSGQNFNARYFDRSFLIEGSREDWIRIAKKMQENLTDAVIKNAINRFPAEGYKITGEEIVSTLKARRDKLVDFAQGYYEILAKGVSIPGTLEDDFFEVIRYDNGSVEVNVYPRKKGKKKKKARFYHRIFLKGETNEIRLYGIEGKDEYSISGKTKKSILVRVIAGFDKDHIEDKSEVRGLRKMTKVYDTEGKIEYAPSKETKLKQMTERKAYDFDRKDFTNNKLIPGVSIGSNPNDGFFIGPGFKFVKYGFKKQPYAQVHSLMANYAFGSDGLNLEYKFDFIDAIGNADLAGKLRINTPLVYQYFGAGNEPLNVNNDRDANKVRMNDYFFMPSLKFASESHSQIFNIGLTMERVSFDQSPTIELTPWKLEKQDFIGIGVDYTYQNKDDQNYPTRGLVFKVNAAWNNSVNNTNVDYLKLGTELSIYLPLRFMRKQTTFNFRTGIEHNIGEYAFFQANFLNGFTNFRGIQRNRFSGRTSSYNNAELRMSLFKVRNYVAPFDIGILAHADVARVWEDNEQSDKWYPSYGGGMFLNILDSFTLIGTYSVSEIDKLFLLGTKFFF
jgi:hypothetical protein